MPELCIYVNEGEVVAAKRTLETSLTVLVD